MSPGLAGRSFVCKRFLSSLKSGALIRTPGPVYMRTRSVGVDLSRSASFLSSTTRIPSRGCSETLILSDGPRRRGTSVAYGAQRGEADAAKAAR